MLPEINIGDLLFIHDAGAHGFSMGYNYNGKLRSAESVSYTHLGAYNGDTIQELGRLTDWQWREVLAVEPDRRNCRKLRLLADELAEKGPVSYTHQAPLLDGGCCPSALGTGKLSPVCAAKPDLQLL